jgi:hypothetical protein
VTLSTPQFKARLSNADTVDTSSYPFKLVVNEASNVAIIQGMKSRDESKELKRSGLAAGQTQNRNPLLPTLLVKRPLPVVDAGLTGPPISQLAALFTH